MTDDDGGPAEGYVEPADDGEGYIPADADRFRMSLTGPGTTMNLSHAAAEIDPRLAAATTPAGGPNGVNAVTVHVSSAEISGTDWDGWCMAHLTPDGARRLASQLLTAAEYAEDGDHFNPETNTSEIHFTDSETDHE